MDVGNPVYCRAIANQDFAAWNFAGLEIADRSYSLMRQLQNAVMIQLGSDISDSADGIQKFPIKIPGVSGERLSDVSSARVPEDFVAIATLRHGLMKHGGVI